MKKRLELFTLLVIMIIGAFTFTSRSPPFTANATYVEGDITQDTVWTLIDSPFMACRNVTIHSGVTLTIEPGVEVRFGGRFSLIVEGRLCANGTHDKVITFTSNRYEPEAGDWETIKFSGTQPSVLVYCIVMYATNGITVENSVLKIQNSVISTNSENGITIANSNVEVESNEVADSAGGGIYITGDNQVTIQNNTLRSNGDGIILTGNSTSGVTVSQNIMLLNEQGGIHLDADAYSDLIILSNNVSANNYGFYVSGNASTCIANNSISYNSVGFFYESAQSHVAHFNDFYGNGIGMDVSSGVIVNATYNYWGHESGPYHEFLNPAGKGNPVGGDGVNLDFIPFLTAPVGHINMRPTATLLTDKTLISPNQSVTFIATTSSDDRRVDQYFLDFGDGSNSGWTTLSIFVHKYSSVGTYNARLTVMDDFGVTSNNVAVKMISVQNLTSLEAALIPSIYRVGYNEQVPITVYVTNGISAMENAEVTLFSIMGGSFTYSSGSTNSTGYFTTTFTAPNVTQITNVRITATASKSGYADGSDYKYLEVLPPLSVQVDAETALIKSEETSRITVHVTHIGQPVAYADVSLLSDGGGNFSATTNITDLNGDAEFVFTAPQTTERLNLTIMANARKIGYVECHGQTAITVEPKILVVEIAAEPTALTSEAKSKITVHVTYEAAPISNANVTVLSDRGGSFFAETEITDSNGNVTLTFTSPQANEPFNVTITANATKNGYASGVGYVQITVHPGTLDVQVAANPTTIESRGTATVTAQVTCNATPVANANVTVLSDSGNFSENTGITDSSGYCVFIFNAPQTTAQMPVVITANAVKNGYTSAEYQTMVTIIPETVPGYGGWSLTTILLIAIPIAIVAIVLILIKLKVINIAFEETER